MPFVPIAAASEVRDITQFGARGDGSTPDTSAFAAALAVGGEITIERAGTYVLTPLTFSVAGTRLICGDGVTLSFPVLGASARGITVAADDVRIEGNPTIQGPAGGVYVADETGLYVAGSSSSSRRSGLSIQATFKNFGSYGVFGKWTNNIELSDCILQNNGYAGAVFSSCDKGIIRNCRVDTLTPGTASNAYGISLSHDSTNYSSDPYAGTQQAANPFCADWVIESCVVENVPLWSGFDAHGGYNIKIDKCSTYNCRIPISIASSSGAAANYAGWDNSITNCTIDSRKRDGTAGTCANLHCGIIISGGSTVRHQRVQCVGNRINGYGVIDTAAGAIQAEMMNGVIIKDNIIANWAGAGVICSDAWNAIIKDNIFEQLANGADTAAHAIRNLTASAAPQTISGNKVVANGGTAAKEGFRTAATVRPFVCNNDFAAVTTVNKVVTSYAANYWAGTDGMPTKVIDLGSGGGSTTIDLSEFGWGTPRVRVYLTAGAPTTVTNIVGMPVGTVVELIISAGSSAITYNRAFGVLANSANFVGTGYSTLVLTRIADSPAAIQWSEVTRAANG